MGDTGAMLIGLVLAASVVSLTGQVNYANLPPEASFPVLLRTAWPTGSDDPLVRAGRETLDAIALVEQQVPRGDVSVEPAVHAVPGRVECVRPDLASQLDIDVAGQFL